jgi:hypothetical protein
MAAKGVRGPTPTLTVTYIPVALYTTFSAKSRLRGRDMSYMMKQLIQEFVAKGKEFKWAASKANFPGDKRHTARHRNPRLYKTLVVKSIPPDLYEAFDEACKMHDCSLMVVCRRLISKWVRTERNKTSKSRKESV